MITLLDHFTYDDMERLLTHTQQINGSTAQVIALNEYDPLGQLITKEVGGTSTSGSDRWQEINYTYNIRGWLTEINDMGLVLAGKGAEPPTMGDDLFAFKLQYNTLVNGGSGIAEPLYNGNIAQTFWKTSTDNIQRGYTYNYDQLNRLRAADFYKGGTVPYTGSNGEYIAYDLNGNIVNLIRTTADLGNNAIDMDNLTYTYQNGNNNSNRLMRVEDSTSVFDTNGFLNGNSGTDDYAYDANGNMTKDKNKDITSIEYNYLNLPTEITFGNGNSIEYIYSAAGVKVSKIVTDLSNTTTPTIFTDYLDGFQYVGGMLNFFPHAEGYVRATSQTEDPADPQLVFNYVYNYVDHLGNIRLSYTKDPVSNELDILEENNYYPFGLKHKIYGGIKKDYLKEESGNGGGGAIRPGVVIDGPYNYKYNGKEFQDELGLGLYDYHARNYDPALGRWNVIDPMAPKYFSHSPYSYTLNNPVYFIDPDGMQVKTGDPDETISPDDPVLLPTAVITKKVKKKNSSGSSWGFIPQKYNPFRNFDAGNYFLGYDYEKQHARMQEPYFREGYFKMKAAMDEGYLYTIGFFGGSLAAMFATPVVLSYGSVVVESLTAETVINYATQTSLKFTLDITTKAIISGDLQPSDVTSAVGGAIVPGKAWFASGFVAEGTGLGTKVLMGSQIDGNDVWSAGIKSFMVSPLGTATGNAMEAVTTKTAGMAIEAVHNNAQGFIIDDSLKY